MVTIGLRGHLIRVSDSRVVVGTRSVTLVLGSQLTCHYVQFDSDNAFGEKHELFSYRYNFSLSPYYLGVAPMEQKIVYSILLSPKCPLLEVGGKKSQITSNFLLQETVIETVIKT